MIFDAETGSAISRLERNDTRGVNRVVAHPILPIIVAAYEDRHIRFYDYRSATLTHGMVAHLDAVTSLAVDPHGLYLLSGSACTIYLFYHHSLLFFHNLFVNIYYIFFLILFFSEESLVNSNLK